MLSQLVGSDNRLCDNSARFSYRWPPVRDTNALMGSRHQDVSQQKLEEQIRKRASTQKERADLIKEIAEYCGCGRELIYMMLNGSRRITDEKLEKLAEYFDVSATYLKFGTPPLDPGAVDDVVHVVMAALIDRGVIQTSVTPDQISSLVARVATDYEANGRMLDYGAIYSYIRIMAPAASDNSPK